MSDRGMKKWAPYKSLVEQGYSLNSMAINAKKVDKPLISNEMAEEINEILVNYHGQDIKITYWRNGFIKEEISCFKIKIEERKIVLPTRKSISFSEILSLENID